MTGLLGRASVRHHARHRGQLALAALGIALGVSLAVGIDVGTASVRRAFALSSEAVTGRATHAVSGGPGGVPEVVYRDLRLNGAIPAGVILAPIVEGTVAPEAGGGALRVLGIDPFADAPFRGAGSGVGAFAPEVLAALLTRPGAVILSADTAAALGVLRGGSLMVRAAGRRVTLTVVDIRNPSDRDQRRAAAWLALADVATAQELFAMQGRLSRIDVIVATPTRDRPTRGDVHAAGDAKVMEGDAWLAKQLPAHLSLDLVAGRGGALAQMTRAFDLNLRALSLLALLVGAFLIYNTMSFSVVQRRPMLAVMRTLGATRAELGRQLLLEALLLGMVASVLGVLLGLGLSRGLTRLIARAVSDLYFAVAVTDIAVPAGPLVRGFLLGLVAAVISAVPAARDATGAEPNLALHRSRLEARSRIRTPRLAAGALVLAAVALWVLRRSGISLQVALGALLVLLVACAGLVPAMVLLAARSSAVVLGVLRGATGRLAARGIAAGLSRTGVATAALTLALSVTTGLGVMVSSFREAVASWLGATLQADVYVSAPSSLGARADNALPQNLLARLGAVAGVAAVGSNRIAMVPVNGVPTLLMAVGVAPGADLGVELIRGGATEARALFDGGPGAGRDGDGVLVSEPLSFKRGVGVGDSVTVATDRGARVLNVVGVYRDYASDAGAVMMSRAVYDRLFDDRLVTGIALYARSGVDAEELVARVRARLGPEDALWVRSNRALRGASMEIFDRTFEVTSVLRLIALIVATVGVTSALMALGLERERERATLRALGATPTQIVEITVTETGLLGLWAGLLAIPLGLLLAVILVHVINQRSFGWTMPLSPQWRVLVLAPALGVAAGCAAGIYPAWRASRVVPAQALRDE